MAELLHPPADVLRWLLIDEGAGTDPRLRPLEAWPVYYPEDPGTPDNVLVTADTTPVSHGRLMVSGAQSLHHGIQVRIRAYDHPTGWLKAWGVKQLLDRQVNNVRVTVGSTVYVVEAVSATNLLLMGREPNSNRRVFSINGLLALRAA
jgi:hypothetical protein